MKTHWKKMLKCSVLAGLSCAVLTGLKADESVQASQKKVDFELTLEVNAKPPAELRGQFMSPDVRCNVHSTSWNHDSSMLAAGVTCKDDRNVTIPHVQILQKDILTYKSIRIPSGESVDKVNAVFSPDGSLLAVSTNDKGVRFYDAKNNFILKYELRDNNHTYPTFAFSPDGTLFAVEDNHDVKVYNVKRDFQHVGTKYNILPVNLRFVSDNTLLVRTPSGAYVLHSNDSFNFHDIAYSFRFRKGYYAKSLDLSSDRSLLAFSTRRAGVLFQNSDPSMMCEKYFPCFGYNFLNKDFVETDLIGITSMAFNNDGSLLVAGGIGFDDSVSETVSILSKGESGWSEMKSIKEPKTAINSVSFSPDGELLAVAGVEGKIWLYEVNPVDEITPSEMPADEIPPEMSAETPVEPTSLPNLLAEYTRCAIFGQCN